MGKVELFVKLVIPDTTAITAFHTLERMGFKLDKLERYDYYSFEVDPDNFFDTIKKVDVVVNANKHKASDSLEKCDCTDILVQDLEQGNGLLNVLRDRLGLTQIKSMEKGVLWRVYADKDTSIKIAKELLYNENYQKITIL